MAKTIKKIEEYNKLIDKKANDFYVITKSSFEAMVKRHGIKKVSRYFTCTDDLLFTQLFKDENNLYEDIKKNHEQNLLFLKFCYHIQNTSRGCGAVIRFANNVSTLFKFFCNYNPKAFIDYFKKYANDEEKINDEYRNVIMGSILFNMLKNPTKDLDEARDEFLNYIKSANSTGAKDNPYYKVTLSSYCKRAYSFANYLITNNIDTIEIFKNNLPNKSLRGLVNYMMKETNSSSSALICDFLKEVDSDFNKIGKPDYHVKRVLNAFLDIDEDGDFKLKDDLAYSESLIKIVNGVDPKEKLTVYKLDRMIYIVGSGNFFLDQKDYGQEYLSKISKL